jgi:hypothetical protein
MPQVPILEFKQLPLRVHTFLTGVPLHDVWSVDLPRWRVGITLNDFLQAADKCLFSSSGLGRILLGIRLFIGRFFGWDRESASTIQTFATRLSESDRWESLSEPGTRDGFFRVVYRFEHEQLVELSNRTAHAAALTALVETTTGYHFYLAVYVRSGDPFTRFYMALIDPFRKMIVYPSLLRSVRARWDQTFGKSGKRNVANCRCD